MQTKKLVRCSKELDTNKYFISCKRYHSFFQDILYAIIYFDKTVLATNNSFYTTGLKFYLYYETT